MARPLSVHQGIRKPVHLNLGQAVPHRTLNDGCREFDLFVFGKAGGLAELVNQRPLLGLGRGLTASEFVGLLGFLERRLYLDLFRRGQQIIYLGHGNRFPDEGPSQPVWIAGIRRD